MSTTQNYASRLPRCPRDGTILDDAPRHEHAKRECPTCQCVWTPTEVYPDGA